MFKWERVPIEARLFKEIVLSLRFSRRPFIQRISE